MPPEADMSYRYLDGMNGGRIRGGDTCSTSIPSLEQNKDIHR